MYSKKNKRIKNIKIYDLESILWNKLLHSINKSSYYGLHRNIRNQLIVYRKKT